MSSAIAIDPSILHHAGRALSVAARLESQNRVVFHSTNFYAQNIHAHVRSALVAWAALGVVYQCVEIDALHTAQGSTLDANASIVPDGNPVVLVVTIKSALLIAEHNETPVLKALVSAIEVLAAVHGANIAKAIFIIEKPHG